MRPIGAQTTIKRETLCAMHKSRLMRHVSQVRAVGTKFDVHEISILCDIIKLHKPLTTVDLDNNGIGDAGACAIAEAIKQSRSPLTTVDLSDNTIGNVGATAIAEAITQSTSLAILDLSYNVIGNVGISAIAEAITHSTSLTELNLQLVYLRMRTIFCMQNFWKRRI